VKIVKTAAEDMRGLWRMRKKFWRGEGVVPAPVADRAQPTPAQQHDPILK
jgi:hypothetical protein